MPKTVKSLSTLRNALVLFGLSGTAIAAFVPKLLAGSKSPDFAVFFVVGMAIILLTAVLFNYIDRLGMGFGKTTLVLATGYNAILAAVKLWLVPAALYKLNQNNSFLTLDSFLFPFIAVAFIAVATLLLYLGAFKLMYQVFKRRLQRQLGVKAARTGIAPARILFVVLVALFVGGIAIFASDVGRVLLFVLLALVWSLVEYIRIFTTFIGFAILLALVLAAILATRTFAQVEKRAVELKDATLLANFFWLGCILIALYHAMWMIFLLTLFSIWPLRTYTPK